MSNEQFVKTYVWAHNNGKTSVDIAKKFGVKKNQVYGRANYLRKKGVKLPFLNKHSGRSNLNVDELNALIVGNLANAVE